MSPAPSHLLISDNFFSKALVLLARFPHSYAFSLECKFARTDRMGSRYLDRESYVPVSKTIKRYVEEELHTLDKVLKLLVNPPDDTITCFNYVKHVMEWIIDGAPPHQFLEFSKELDNVFYALDLEQQHLIEQAHNLDLEYNPF